MLNPRRIILKFLTRSLFNCLVVHVLRNERTRCNAHMDSRGSVEADTHHCHDVADLRVSRWHHGHFSSEVPTGSPPPVSPCFLLAGCNSLGSIRSEICVVPSSGVLQSVCEQLCKVDKSVCSLQI